MNITICSRATIFVACAVLAVVASDARGQGFFRVLDASIRPPVGGLSANGRYMVVNTDAGRVARYAIDTMELLDIARGTATDISGDGLTVVGTFQGGPVGGDFIWTSSGGTQPFQITIAGQQALPTTRALSFNGSVVVGEFRDPDAGGQTRGFRWSASSGGIALAGAPATSGVLDLSGNGTYTTGYSFTSPDGARAVRWDASGVRSVLGELPGGLIDADGQAISFNGSVIFGTSASGLSVDEIFRWSITGGMTPIGTPFGSNDNLITGIDSLGNAIVGNAILSDFKAFFWNEELGFVDLNDYLVDQGLVLGSNRIVSVFGMSNDARTFTGLSRSDSGAITTFVARVPSPGGVTCLLPLAAFAARRRRTTLH